MTRGSAAWNAGRLGGLAATFLLQGYWFVQPVPLPAKALTALFLCASLVNPTVGLLAFAGLAPVSTAIAQLSGGGLGLGAQLLEQMALGIAAGVLVRRGSPGERTRIGAPALLLSVVAIASAAVAIPAAAAPLARNLTDSAVLQQLMPRTTAQFSQVWSPMFAALLVAVCGLFGWAVERIVRQEPQLAARVVGMALIGHAGAALLNFQAALGAALRAGEPLAAALPRVLATTRFSHQTDVHAAASALLLAGIAGLGLLSGSFIRRLGVSLLLVIIAVGLWITGSRVAIVLGVVVTLTTIGWLIARTGRRRQFVLVVMAVLALGAGAWLAWQIRAQSLRSGSIANSVNARVILANAGLQLVKENPVFGIGIAQFREASARLVGTSLASVFRENAHNNFLQVLAEQGAVGLLAFLWWLGVVVLGGLGAQRADPTLIRGSLLVAIVACMGTWMTGHPLLVPEFAFVFWFYTGILLATMAPAPAKGSRWPLWVAIAGLVVSVQPRAAALRNAADLEHRGLGLSLWQHDDAQRYREAPSRFSLYLPVTGRPVEVPMRRAPGAPDPVILDIRIEGRRVDRVAIAGDAWQTAVVIPPQGARRFELVDFVVQEPPKSAEPQAVLLRVGKAVAR